MFRKYLALELPADVAEVVPVPVEFEDTIGIKLVLLVLVFTGAFDEVSLGFSMDLAVVDCLLGLLKRDDALVLCLDVVAVERTLRFIRLLSVDTGLVIILAEAVDVDVAEWAAAAAVNDRVLRCSTFFVSASVVVFEVEESFVA